MRSTQIIRMQKDGPARVTISRMCRLIFAGTALACLAACGATEVQVAPVFEFPTPLVEPLPVHMGVYYSENFRNFTYYESKDEQGIDDTSIKMGEAQISLFEKILPSVFEQVQVLERGESASSRAHLDAVLVPQIIDVEYSVPQTNKAKIYEVWIKYKFDLLALDGSSIASWTMPAYGKTPTALLKSSKEAINLASVMALRDCGAAFITGFTRVPEVAQWLDTSIGNAAPADRIKQEEVSYE